MGTTDRGHRRYKQVPLGRSFLLFLLGLSICTAWGCQSQRASQRTKRSADGLPIDQYDDFLSSRKQRSPQARRRASSSSQSGSWLEGSYRAPSQGNWGQQKQYNPPAGNGTPMQRCLQLGSGYAQKQCLYPLLGQGTQSIRKKNLKELLGTGYPGMRAIVSLLKQGDVSMRTFLIRSTLGDQVTVRTVPVSFIKAMFKIARQDFLEGLALLKSEQQLEVATKLVTGLRFFTRKRITKEFGSYLKLSSQDLWSKIKQETTLPTSMAMVSLSGCVQSQPKVVQPYNKAMLSLQTYYTTWQVWDMAAKASGVRTYLRALRAYRSGRLYRRPRPRFNRTALRLAIVLARRLQAMREPTGKAIQSVPHRIPKQRMKSWFSSLLSKSPKLGKQGTPSTPKRPNNPNGSKRIEL